MSTEKYKDKKNLIYPNDKIINIIVRDINGNNRYLETIKYNEKKHKSLDDIGSYITKKFNSAIGLCCCYDFNTKRNIIYNKTKGNNDFINWKIDFYNLSIKEAFHYTYDNSITVVVLDFEFGLGGAGELSLLVKIEVFRLIITIIKKIRNILKIVINPFAELNKRYHVDEDLVKATILLGSTWKVGFITTEEIENKKLIETSIMRKLGYKKCKDKWIMINKIYPDIDKLYY